METTKCVLDTGFIHLEPHSLRSGPGKKFEVKRYISQAIHSAVPETKLESARTELQNELVKVEICFHLWANPPTGTDTRAKKDLDNLVKPVLDVLQTWLDAGLTEKGLRIIDKDSYICELRATKDLSKTQDGEGINIRIFEHEDEGMRAVLQK